MDKKIVGAADVDAPGLADRASENTAGSTLAAHAENIARRESAVIDDEAAMLGREKSAAAREQAAHLREGVVDIREDAADRREAVAQAREGEAHLREGAAASRERGARDAVTVHAAFEDQLHMLQQANANLVIASIDAHRLTEEVETTKIELDHLAHHDVLTGLPNRMLLEDRLGQAIEVAHRQGRQLAVIYMDLDRFKHINDSLGHAVGDELLKSVAQRLVACVRHSDTVSRQGGDEFVLLLPYIEHAEDAALSAQKILAAIALAHPIDGHQLHIGVSIGISIYPDDGADTQSLLKSADTSMYHAKENGRNSFKFFEPAMNARAVQRQSVEASLRQALDRHEFVLHYQPKINLHSGTIVGVEALIRWQHPRLGLLLPSEFVPIAEDCGLILPMGRWVMREACRQARAWQQAGLPAISMAVNTSALELRANDFLDNLCATLADTGLEAHWLELELTESVLMRDAESTDRLLQGISDLGVKLAIDDFGTGYSSLSYLRRFPINALKIDQSFVNEISGNPDDAIIVSAVVSLGKSLKRRVVAEGVETSAQYAFLRALNCEEGQGHYFGQPMPAQALANLLHAGLALATPD